MVDKICGVLEELKKYCINRDERKECNGCMYEDICFQMKNIFPWNWKMDEIASCIREGNFDD